MLVIFVLKSCRIQKMGVNLSHLFEKCSYVLSFKVKVNLYNRIEREPFYLTNIY